MCKPINRKVLGRTANNNNNRTSKCAKLKWKNLVDYFHKWATFISLNLRVSRELRIKSNRVDTTTTTTTKKKMCAQINFPQEYMILFGFCSFFFCSASKCINWKWCETSVEGKKRDSSTKCERWRWRWWCWRCFSYLLNFLPWILLQKLLKMDIQRVFHEKASEREREREIEVE